MEELLQLVAVHGLTSPRQINRRRTLLALKTINETALTLLKGVLSGMYEVEALSDEESIEPDGMVTFRPGDSEVAEACSDQAYAALILATLGRTEALDTIKRLRGAEEQPESKKVLTQAVRLLERQDWRCRGTLATASVGAFMTAQLDDTVLYRGREYCLAAFNGEELFDPTAHGVTPARRMSTCWRGYLCEYEIVEEQLTLQRLKVILFDEEFEAARRSNGPLVFGKTPNCDVHQAWIVYSDLGARLDYTGGVFSWRRASLMNSS